MARDTKGRTIVDYYGILEQTAKDEYITSIDYRWNARWLEFLNAGNWLTAPEPYDGVETMFRLEETFGFGISTRDGEQLVTIAQTVRYLWDRNRRAERLSIRALPAYACRGAFIFHELRRLLIDVGGVSAVEVSLDVTLKDLLPSWRTQFLSRLEQVLTIELPQARLLSFERRMVNKPIRELVS